MGWGAGPNHRADLLGGAVSAKRNLASLGRTAYVWDGNATFRNFAGLTSKVPRSAAFVVQIVLKTMPRSQTPTAVCVLFDDGSRMMPERAALHRERYRNVKPPSAAAMAAAAGVSPFQIRRPFDFTLLFQTPAGKKLAYALLAQALYVELCTTYADRGFAGFAVGMPTGEVRAHGHGPPLPTAEVRLWGEADQKCYVAAAAADNAGWKAIVATIDTDMVLQCICRWAPGAPTRVCLKKESVDVPVLLARFGGVDPGSERAASVRLSAAVMLIAAFGCDYSNPLSRFGYRKMSVAAQARLMQKQKGRLPLTHHAHLPTVLVGDAPFAVVAPTTAVSLGAHRMLTRRTAADPWTALTFNGGSARRVRLRKQPAAGPGLSDAYLYDPGALVSVLGRATRVFKKAATNTPRNLLKEALRSVWAVVYFAGATAGHGGYAGPTSMRLPPAAFVAALQKQRCGYVVHSA